MKKILDKIDEIIGSLPPHIVDIIQKGAIALAALLIVIAIVIGISKGFKAAKPGGLQLAKDTNDLFYIERLRQENASKIKLIEDVESNEFLEFKINRKNLHYKNLKKDTMNHLLGEKDKLLELSDDWQLRKKDPGFLTDDIPVNENYNRQKENLIQDDKEVLLLKDSNQKSNKNKKIEKKIRNITIKRNKSKKKLEFMQ